MENAIFVKGLKDVLHPISLESFYRTYYEKKVCLIKRGNHDYFKSLLNVNHLDDYLTNRTIQFPKIRMVDYNRELKSDSYTNANGTVNAVNAIKEFHNGATLVFSGLQDQIENMKYLVDTVSRDLWHKLQTNIYYTPMNSQGFQAHYDTHDVFVLQTSGSKKWYIFDNDEMKLPLKSQSFEVEKYNPGNIIQEFILEEGDTLYIPRGVFHCAETLDSHSMHITLGLLAVTWSDFLVENILNLSKKLPELRANVPFHVNNREKNQLVAEMLLDLIKDNTNYSGGERRFKQDLTQNQIPVLKNQLAQVSLISQINEDTLFELRDNILFTEKETDSEVEIFIMGNKSIFPAFTKPIIDFIKKTTEPFTVNDLPEVIDSNGKITLMKRLTKEGFVFIKNLKNKKNNEEYDLSIANSMPSYMG